MISGDRRHSHSSTRKDVLICENGHFIIIYSLRWRENNGPVLPWHTQSLEKIPEACFAVVFGEAESEDTYAPSGA